MRVELEHFPLFARKLDSIVVVQGRTFASRGARSQSVPVVSGYELEVCEDVVLREETELDLVAGDIEEDRVRLEDLPEDGVR